jgi:hypothetical protein
MSNVTIKVTIKEKDTAKDFERAETSTFGFDGNYTQAQEVMKKIGIAVQDRSDEITGRQQLPLNGEVDEEEINEDFPSSRKSKKAK